MSIPSASIDAQAFSQIPGYRETHRKLETAKGWRLNPTPPDSWEQIREDVRAAAMNGDPVPTGVLERLNTVRLFEGSWLEAHEMVKQLVQESTTELASVMRDGADHALRWLDGSMQDLRSEVLELAGGPLKTSRSAREAAAAGSEASAAWGQLELLANRYERIRAVQHKITREGIDTTDDPTASFNQVFARSANFADAIHREGHWIVMRNQARRATAEQSHNQTPGLDDWLAWLDSVPRPQWNTPQNIRAFPTEAGRQVDRGAFLLWAMQEAHPWVPTIRQMWAVDDQHQAIVKVIEDPQHGGWEPSDRLAWLQLARDNIERLTGIDHAGNPTGKPRADGNSTSTLAFGPRKRPVY